MVDHTIEIGMDHMDYAVNNKQSIHTNLAYICQAELVTGLMTWYASNQTISIHKKTYLAFTESTTTNQVIFSNANLWSIQIKLSRMTFKQSLAKLFGWSHGKNKNLPLGSRKGYAS